MVKLISGAIKVEINSSVPFVKENNSDTYYYDKIFLNNLQQKKLYTQIYLFIILILLKELLK